VTFGWAAVASAHVTVSPSSLPQGTGDAILTFRVPNESATASVTGLKIQFPSRTRSSCCHRRLVRMADEGGEREAGEADHHRRRDIHQHSG